jgi:hypothetical protein
MVQDQYTLQTIRAAFERLAKHDDLEGWILDPLGWNYDGRQDTSDTDIRLVRGETERASITILPRPNETENSLQAQIMGKMREQGLISN